jgi:hypothetical protein
MFEDERAYDVIEFLWQSFGLRQITRVEKNWVELKE